MSANNPQMTSQTVLITRPEKSAQDLAQAIAAGGGKPLLCPTICIESLDVKAECEQKISALDANSIIIFSSQYAVPSVAPLLKNFSGKVLAIGPTTAQALARYHVDAQINPQPPYNSEALLDLASLQSLQAQSVLIVKGEGGREHMSEVLAKRGAEVQLLNVYKRRIPENCEKNLQQLLKNTEIDTIVTTSNESLENLYKAAAEQQKQILVKLLIVVSERGKALAEGLGFTNIRQARSAANQDIIDCIKEVIHD